MKPTEQEIEDAAKEAGKTTHGEYPTEARVHYRVGFIDGANWAISPIQPTEQKSMLDFLNEVSIERGYTGWYQVYSSSNVNYIDLNDIPQKAGKRYAAQAISQMQPEWVAVNSVSDLPTKYGKVIIYGRFTKDCPKNVFMALYNPKTRKFYSEGIQSKDVTHWMDKPQPPTDKP